MKLYFVTSSAFKPEEVRQILATVGLPQGLEVVPIGYQLQEILDVDISNVVRAKCLRAFEWLHLPCVVEHGALCIDSLNGLPGGLSKPVWDALEGKLPHLLPRDEGRGATHRVMVGYCDGRRVHIFKGEKRGTIAQEARGTYRFQYDPIFIPEGADQTLAEMGLPKKLEFSPAPQAWSELVRFLNGRVSGGLD